MQYPEPQDTDRAVHRADADTLLCVAVTGVGGGVGQAILRALRRSTLVQRVVGFDMNARGAGLYQADVGYRLPLCSDPGYVDRLVDILVKEHVSVLIPGSDPELSVLARARSGIEEAGIKVMVGSPETVGICRDKQRCSEFFRERGFPFVHTVPISDAVRLADEVGYPLVVKPADGSASRGVAVVFGPKELGPHLARPGYIAQEAAFPESWTRSKSGLNEETVCPGGRLRQEEEISIQVVHDHLGEYLGAFASVNRLQGGVPLFVDPTSLPDVESVVEKMGSALRDQGLIGPCNFQARLTSEGPRVFEINPRFTGITGVRAAMGFNAVDAVIRRIFLSESADSVRKRLSQPTDRVAARYVDEMLIARDRLEVMGP